LINKGAGAGRGCFDGTSYPKHFYNLLKNKKMTSQIIGWSISFITGSRSPTLPNARGEEFQ
jgi:hypothetical protein